MTDNKNGNDYDNDNHNDGNDNLIEEQVKNQFKLIVEHVLKTQQTTIEAMKHNSSRPLDKDSLIATLKEMIKDESYEKRSDEVLVGYVAREILHSMIDMMDLKKPFEETKFKIMLDGMSLYMIDAVNNVLKYEKKDDGDK